MRPTLIGAAVMAGALTVACAPTQDASSPGDGAQPTPVACQAGDYQEYVDRNRSSIPADAPAGRSFRVACSSCAVTMDYRFDRVTFVYDDKTNLITRVSCG